MRLLLSFLLLAPCLHVSAQSAYKLNDQVKNVEALRMLNYSTQSSDLNGLKKSITILDFFGTWCAPCIRAIPNLAAIQQQFAGTVQVILISVEKENQLQRFLKARQPFPFPIIADERMEFSNYFQPPALPYTVVLDQNNHIIAIIEAAEITPAKIKEWQLLNTSAATTTMPGIEHVASQKSKDTMAIGQAAGSQEKMAQQFIYAVKTGDETAAAEAGLKALSFTGLQNALSTDDQKKAFWINIYNGYTQLLLKKDPGQYKKRNRFFKAKSIPIAGRLFSLDEIEHDILRRSKIKWSLGYLGKPFPGKTAKALRVKKLDYRIHFALNCGAKSCPPVAFYESARIDAQLDMATKAYLTSETVYENNRLQLPAIMGWFRRDFKGKKNMVLLVKKLGLVPADAKPAVSFKKYNWDLFLDNYKTPDHG